MSVADNNTQVKGDTFTNEPVSLAVGIRNALRKFTHEPTVKDKDLLGTFIEMLTAHVKADLIDTSVIYDTLKESVPIKNPYIRISCVQMVREIDCFEFWHKIIVVGK